MSNETGGPEPSEDERWLAVARRDAAADGQFLFSVKTTGVYCRPSCAARMPRRENVAFHPDAAAARAAGFRPCKRCRPDGPSRPEREAAMIAAACRMIDDAEAPLPLSALAEAAGLSPHHFHRVFRRVTGLTPRAYKAARRAESARRELQDAGSVTEAIYGAGFSGPSRFYAASPAMLGMRPSAYRAGGSGETIRFAVGEISLGSILVAATERGVCAILLGDEPDELARDLQDRFPKAEIVGGDEAFEATVAAVVGMVERPGGAPDLPLDIRGTAFQERVWRVLRDVPAGATVSYAEVARRIGAPAATRAVAQACGANALAVAIPCHRVVRADGAPSGYRWGVERKRALLELESEVA
jgi:AraC family transcriptional regulator of adaptative response/methylated-DNA-[protein]-cysteine methyltransferase